MILSTALFPIEKILDILLTTKIGCLRHLMIVMGLILNQYTVLLYDTAVCRSESLARVKDMFIYLYHYLSYISRAADYFVSRGIFISIVNYCIERYLSVESLILVT